MKIKLDNLIKPSKTICNLCGKISERQDRKSPHGVVYCVYVCPCGEMRTNNDYKWNIEFNFKREMKIGEYLIISSSCSKELSNSRKCDRENHIRISREKDGYYIEKISIKEPGISEQKEQLKDLIFKRYGVVLKNNELNELLLL